jgi:hypothetical protein
VAPVAAVAACLVYGILYLSIPRRDELVEEIK